MRNQRISDLAFAIAVAAALIATRWPFLQNASLIVALLCATVAAISLIRTHDEEPPEQVAPVSTNAAIDRPNVAGEALTVGADRSVEPIVFNVSSFYQSYVLFERKRTFADEIVDIVKQLNPPEFHPRYRFTIADGHMSIEPWTDRSEYEIEMSTSMGDRERLN